MPSEITRFSGQDTKKIESIFSIGDVVIPKDRLKYSTSLQGLVVIWIGWRRVGTFGANQVLFVRVKHKDGRTFDFPADSLEFDDVSNVLEFNSSKNKVIDVIPLPVRGISV